MIQIVVMLYIHLSTLISLIAVEENCWKIMLSYKDYLDKVYHWIEEKAIKPVYKIWDDHKYKIVSVVVVVSIWKWNNVNPEPRYSSFECDNTEDLSFTTPPIEIQEESDKPLADKIHIDPIVVEKSNPEEHVYNTLMKQGERNAFVRNIILNKVLCSLDKKYPDGVEQIQILRSKVQCVSDESNQAIIKYSYLYLQKELSVLAYDPALNPDAENSHQAYFKDLIEKVRNLLSEYPPPVLLVCFQCFRQDLLKKMPDLVECDDKEDPNLTSSIQTPEEKDLLYELNRHLENHRCPADPISVYDLENLEIYLKDTSIAGQMNPDPTDNI